MTSSIQDTPAKPRIERLSNGLTVLHVYRPDCGVVAVDLWARVGSADETPLLNGASHFLEHMLFKGTAKYQVGEIDRLVEGVGGVVNAGTSHDFTHYYVTVAAAEFPTAISVIADMVQNATLAPEEVDRERQVIIEEYLIKQDHPRGLLYEHMYDRAFESGPYKAPVLGTPETLARIGAPELRDYYERHYTPENLTLLLVGDIPYDQAMEQAEKVFAGFSRTYRPYTAEKKDTRYALPDEHLLEKPIHETYGTLLFPAPALENHQEAYGLDVLQFLLGGGDASILYQEIKEKRQLASSIYVGYASSRYPDLLYIVHTCEKARRAELEAAVLEQLEKVAAAPPSEVALARAKRLLINEHLFSLETTNGQSSSIGYYYTVTGDLAFEWNYSEGVAQITAKDIQELARRWLAPDKAIRVAVEPAS